MTNNHSSYVDFLEGDVITTEFNKMEDKGYYLLNSNPKPSEQEVEAIEDSVGKNELRGDFQSDTVPTKYFSWEQYRKEIRPEIKELWKKFMGIGINLDVNLLSRFENVGDTFQQGPIVVRFIPNSAAASLKRSHPCRDGLSIWRPIRNSLGPENGMFKVYPGSHHVETIGELQSSGIKPVEVWVRADQVLFTHGGLWIETLGSGGGTLMWMGVSTHLVGLHIDRYSLHFIADAYSASHLLSR
ncbi:hypothetical protein CNMCM8927_003569 [Aspergillus lentulus]|uniref:Uncharacterized protein n=1 Tax=Aspergillus lentulus TaxID=293939 RepID=A0AAN5YSB1_ASPLE|nr:hypothetical protein CNMCM8927_003569 [Aspergillus lentulus]